MASRVSRLQYRRVDSKGPESLCEYWRELFLKKIFRIVMISLAVCWFLIPLVYVYIIQRCPYRVIIPERADYTDNSCYVN